MWTIAFGLRQVTIDKVIDKKVIDQQMSDYFYFSQLC